MRFTRSHWLNLAMVVALIAIALVGRYFSPLLLPKADVIGIVEPGCDLQQRACAANVPGGGRIEFSITPRPIPFLQVLRVEVVTAGIEARKVEVDFAGETMNMGLNRGELAAEGNGRHAGEGSLPVCVTGEMVWIGTVLVETERQRIAVPYRFTVGR
ncbi:MAG: hypothetical protein Q8M11_12460 [Sulfuritalea sp.]|nr:hypothetical protein [Sulfuritalea sp.]MDP1982785.1 hypothetical protein [Sulfuritalea sp.]